MKQPKTPSSAGVEKVGINVRIPASVHRAAKVACAATGMTWDEAATEAFDAWARRRTRKEAT
jgi:hypothetical protein